MSEAGNEASPGAEAGAEPGVDMSAVMDRMEQLSGEIGTLRESVAPPEQEQQEQYGYDPYAGQGPFPEQPQYGGQPNPYAQPPQQNPYGYGYAPQPQPGYSPQQVAQQFALDPANVYDDYGNVNPQAAQHYQQMLQQAVVNPAIQQAVAPIMQQLREERLDRGAEALLQKYPEYNDEAKAKGLVAEVREWAARAGLDPQEAVENDAILEQHILVSRAQQQATQGAAAAGGPTHELESGQGAGPGGAPATFSDQVNNMRREMTNGAPPEALSFWGVKGI